VDEHLYVDPDLFNIEYEDPHTHLDVYPDMDRDIHVHADFHGLGDLHADLHPEPDAYGDPDLHASADKHSDEYMDPDFFHYRYLDDDSLLYPVAFDHIHAYGHRDPYGDCDDYTLAD